MYDAVYEWCGHNNRENKQLAFLALEAFLQQVMSGLVPSPLQNEKGEGGRNHLVYEVQILGF